MFATLQRRKACELSLRLLVIASLLLSLLPTPALAFTALSSTPSTEQHTLQQAAEPAPDPVPQPEPAPQWPEVGERALYAPDTESLAMPQTLAPVQIDGAEMQTSFAVEPPVVPELVLPVEPLEIVLDGGALAAAQVGTLPLTLQAEDAEVAAPLLGRVQMLPAAEAARLSPLDFVFSLHLHSPGTSASVQASVALTAVLDYSRIPLAQVSDVASRLAFYRASGCTVAATVVDDKATAGGGEDDLSPHQPPASSIVCTDWEQLPAYNDETAQQLSVQLPALAVASTAAPVAAQADPPVAEEQAQAAHLYLPFMGAERDGNSPIPPAPEPAPSQSQAAGHLYLPFVSGRGEQPPPPADGGAVADTLYILSTSASGSGGDYSATPLSLVNDYQADLYTGAFATSYPIAVPPAAAGAAPSLRLVYNSGGVDAMTSDKNNQPSNIGLGWELDTGSITRLIKPCTGMGFNYAGLCSTGNNYVLSLNGVTSRLIPEGGNRYHLQHDPLWKVEYYTTTLAAHPDLDKRYWQITTPDGAKYRFGGEFEQETGADQNSVYYAPVHISTPPAKYIRPPSAWRWNLDRVEDANGNVISYFYDLEIHYYYSTSTYKHYPYVRAGNLSRIEYTKRAGQITQPHARVLFNMEIRCEDPTSAAMCTSTAAYRDAPVDLSCILYGENSCRRLTPAFWSERRLDSIQTQVYDQTSGRWRTVGYYDLRHEFPGFMIRKLWLSAIQQRAGGDYQLSAFTQLEAEKFDATSNVTATQMVLNSADWGMGDYVYNGGPNSYFVLRDVDFGSGASSLLLRYRQGVNGALMEFRLDTPAGPQVAGLTRSVGGYDVNKWLTVSVPVMGASGTHDLYVVFKQASVSLNWLRFLPSSTLAGLSEAVYGYTMLNHRVAATGASQFSLPRLNQITTELGGVVKVTYGQSHPCTKVSQTVRIPYDCFPAYDPASETSLGNGAEIDFALWHKWKVLTLEKFDSFSLNAGEVYSYTYSSPTWRYSDNPLLPNQSPGSCTPYTCNVQHWNDFRGHEIVTVSDSSGAKTEYRFYRGMDGDRLNFYGSLYTATITLSDGSTRPDSNWLAGQVAEVRRIKANGSVMARTVNWYTSTLTAGSVITGSYFTALARQEATSYGSGTGAAGTHTTATSYEYDAYGNVTREVLHGDLVTPTDDRNVQTGYAYNTASYIVDRPQWRKLWAGTGSGAPGEEQAFGEYLYDGATAVGTPPVKGNLTATRSYWQASPSYAYVNNSIAYDEVGRPVTVTDGRGASTTTSYHPFYGYAATVTNALGHVTTSAVDPAFGVPTQTTDANGHVTTLQYDGYGRLTVVWLPSEPTGGLPSYIFSYDTVSRPARVQSRQLQDAVSGIYLESWQYVDGFGRTLQTQSPAATGGNRIVSSRQYNALGQLLHQSAAYESAGAAGSGYVPPNWSTVANYHRFGYDELGNLWLDETKSQAGVLWSAVTIHDGRQKRQYDPSGRRTDYDADAFGNLQAVVEYNTGSAVYTTSYSYSLSGSLTQVTDAAGSVTSMGYDLLGRKTHMSDPDMGQWQYQYDAAGNLVAQGDGRGLWLHMSYDSLNRLTTKRQDDPVSGNLLADYLYDAPGQVGLLSRSRAYNAEGVVEVQALAYDSRGRVTQRGWLAPGAGGGTFRIDTGYNAAGQKTALTYPGGNGGQAGEVVSYGYDAIGQLTGVSGVLGGETTHYLSAGTYNSQGQPLELVNDVGGNGLVRQYVYESNTLRLSMVKAGKSSPFTDLQELSYRYDNNGNVTSVVDGLNGGQRQCLRYDWLDRLTGAFTGDATCSSYSAAGVGAYNHTYTYDAIGNLTKYAGSTYTYGTVNDKPHAVASAFGNSYGYDGNGNQTSRTIAGVEYTLHYDYENRLSEVRQGETVIASFLYDADGNRVKGTVGGVSTVYIGGVYEQSGSAATSYYEGGAMRRAGHVENNGVFYLLTDQLKSTSVIASQAGVEVTRQYYYPYGGNRSGSAFSSLTTRRFTGQHHEASLPGAEGLSYYNARWYDPQLGRFTSPDTLVPDPADPQDLNRYSYSSNNPVSRIDPSGHYDFKPGDDPWWKKRSSGVRPPTTTETTPAKYIFNEMKRNVASKAAQNLRNILAVRNTTGGWLLKALSNPLSESSTRQERADRGSATSLMIEATGWLTAAAYTGWYEQVKYGGPWDHKSTIQLSFGQVYEIGGKTYQFDLWSNIHYGYVGKSLGFHEEELLAGAGIAQLRNEYHDGGFSASYTAEVLNNDPISTYFDTAKDQAAIRFGIALYDTYGDGLTEEIFLNELSLRPELAQP